MEDRIAVRNHAAYWAFVLHRVSGLVLALFLPVHFLVLGLAIEDAAALDGFLKWSENSAVKLAEAGLVFLLAAHLAGGLRLLFIEFVAWTDAQKTLIAMVFAGAAGASLLFLLNA